MWAHPTSAHASSALDMRDEVSTLLVVGKKLW